MERYCLFTFRVICTKIDQNLILNHLNFSSFTIMSYFIYTDFSSGLLDPRLVDLGLTLIHISAYNSKS